MSSSGRDQNDLDDVRRLAGRQVLVVGDLVLDAYVTGRPARVSREAPVLVLEVVEQEDRAGSAASPAANVIALGSQATVVGVVGGDAAGARIEADLRQRGVDPGCIAPFKGLSWERCDPTTLRHGARASGSPTDELGKTGSFSRSESNSFLPE